MGENRWQGAVTERGKPRIYIQQFLDLRLPEPQYRQICKEMGLAKPFEEASAAEVMETYVEEQVEGAQCESVHISRGDNLVVLMTVISFPYDRESYERLTADWAARKSAENQ